MGAERVLYRPIVRFGGVIGYLWCTGGSAGFWPRAGDGADDQVCGFWTGWLDVARERGLTPWEALTSWDPRADFRFGAPAPGGPNELAGVEELLELVEGRADPAPYADDTTVAVRHYQVIRGDACLGRLWASVDNVAAGFLASPGLPDRDPAGEVWRGRLAEARASGLTPTQALHALRDAPDDGTSGRVTDPLGQGYLGDLRR